VPQSVQADGILVPAGDCQNTRHHDLEHRMLNAIRIAIRHCFGEPQANNMFGLRLPQKQHATINWLPPAKSTVSFLRRTDGRSNGSGVSLDIAAVAMG
jgi:hypothetical protein